MQKGRAAPAQTRPSTVLAQDHFFSDFLSLHLTIKTHKASMMMRSGVGSKTSPSAAAADLMNRWSPPLSEWSAQLPKTTHQEAQFGVQDLL